MNKEEFMKELTGKNPEKQNKMKQVTFAFPTEEQRKRIIDIAFIENDREAFAGIASIVSESVNDPEIAKAFKGAAVCVGRAVIPLKLQIVRYGFVFNKTGAIPFKIKIAHDGLYVGIAKPTNENGMFDPWENGYSDQAVVEYAKKCMNEMLRETYKAGSINKAVKISSDVLAEALEKTTRYVEEQE